MVWASDQPWFGFFSIFYPDYCYVVVFILLCTYSKEEIGSVDDEFLENSKILINADDFQTGLETLQSVQSLDLGAPKVGRASEVTDMAFVERLFMLTRCCSKLRYKRSILLKLYKSRKYLSLFGVISSLTLTWQDNDRTVLQCLPWHDIKIDYVIRSNQGQLASKPNVVWRFSQMQLYFRG